MCKMPISVVIPAFNASATIVRTIKSIIRQEFPVQEIIVVDDSSGDKTLDIVRSVFSKNIEKGDIRLFRFTVNKGVSHARNFGARQAVSEFVAFIDADDFWDIDLSKEFYLNINGESDFDFYFWDSVKVAGDKVISQFRSAHETSEQYYESAICGPVINSSKIIIRTSNFLSLTGFPEGVTQGEDLYFWCRLVDNFSGKRLDGVSYIQSSVVVKRWRKSKISFLLENVDGLLSIKAPFKKEYLCAVYARELLHAVKTFDFRKFWKAIRIGCRTLFILQVFLSLPIIFQKILLHKYRFAKTSTLEYQQRALRETLRALECDM